MELVRSSIGVVFPLFVMMAIGMIVKRIGLVTDEGLSEMNRINVRLFLPAMLFANICDGDLLQGANRTFMLFAAVSATIIFLLCILIIPRVVKDKKRSQSIILGIYRPNTAIYGLPLAQSILGDSNRVSNVLMMISVSILVTNFFAVLALEIFRGDKPNLLKSIARSFSNPIIIGLVLGMIAQFLPFTIPPMVLSPIRSIAAITTPLAFICLGADFTFKAKKSNRVAVLLSTLFKLVVTPLVITPIAVFLLGLREESLVAILCAFATPTAVSVLPLIKEAGADDELMGSIIVSTTAFSLISIFLIVYCLKGMALF
ncbi:MAG: AEC family transporter [Oscillospiraceae bacterium]|nr:AEC family transporter [Oscillospiraceae bacterium]